jgi:hypothetical protein
MDGVVFGSGAVLSCTWYTVPLFYHGTDLSDSVYLCSASGEIVRSSTLEYESVLCKRGEKLA